MATARRLMRPAPALRSLFLVPSSSSAPFLHTHHNLPRPQRQTQPGPFATVSSTAQFHTHPTLHRRRQNPEPDRDQSDETTPTNLESLDVLGTAPAPATSIEACLHDGFRLAGGGENGTVSILDGGDGALLVGGEAFAWRPWVSRAGNGQGPRLLNEKGQWEVPQEAFGLLGLVWPQPDLLILGLGPELRPLSPATRRYISSLGIRVDVLDTKNAASQFNLLATERGVADVAAALIPIGWKEGVGAS